jgi:molybdopterin synthase sulfur carrier subunit
VIRLLYFASLRERLGVGEEQLAAPPGVGDVQSLLAHLRARGGRWSDALAPERPLLVAVNQEIAAARQAVGDGDEVAIFPPVTGG